MQPAAIVPPVAPVPASVVEKSIAGKPGWRRLAAIEGGQSVRLPDALQAASIPLIATLPAVRHRRWRRNDLETHSVFQGKTHLVDVLDKPNAAFARAVSSIRKALDGAAGSVGPRRILVAGLRPQAGATTLALNLALDAAGDGQPAMLVDACLGEASLTHVHAPEAQLGLRDVVSGAAGVVRAALQDEGTGLFFLPRAGRVDLVTPAQFARDFVGVTRRFSPIVIDGGTIGGDPLSLAFAEAADDIVLVVREGGIAVGELEQAQAALGENASKIRGIVVNEAL
jgi:Mrp family chromosome partitioning ATPase